MYLYPLPRLYNELHIPANESLISARVYIPLHNGSCDTNKEITKSGDPSNVIFVPLIENDKFFL